MPRLCPAVLLSLAACAPKADAPAARDYLYLWTAAADSTKPDYLAVLDVTEDSARYGRLVTTVPVPGFANGPHHTEHQMPADGRLFVNGFASGKTFIFDMSNPAAPRLDGEFGDVEGMMHPHSYLRLPGGNVLATFQMQHGDSGNRPGGLAELSPRGEVMRASSADLPGVDHGVRPYSAAIVPSLDRVVVTTSDMKDDFPASRTVQIWRLSDLRLLHSISLPDGPTGDEGLLSAEPRVVSDGRTVLVSTFNCGLHLLVGLETESPSARLVTTLPRKTGVSCAIPVVTGRWYLITVPALNAVVSLDISDPAAPREVGRVTLGAADVPHWISLSPDSRRVVITGYAGLSRRVLIATFDSTTGALALDERFRPEGAAAPGWHMDGAPHGAVFGRKDGKTE
jgi:hypothetical protein